MDEDVHDLIERLAWGTSELVNVANVLADETHRAQWAATPGFESERNRVCEVVQQWVNDLAVAAKHRSRISGLDAYEPMLVHVVEMSEGLRRWQPPSVLEQRVVEAAMAVESAISTSSSW